MCSPTNWRIFGYPSTVGKNADFVGQEDAILFSSGFGANAGLLRAILGKNDIAYIDSYIHTSAMSGLIGTNTKRIGHNDIEYLDMILDKEKTSIKRVRKRSSTAWAIAVLLHWQ